MVRIFIFFVLVFLFVFNINFSFFPSLLRTRMLLGGMGLFYCVCSSSKSRSSLFKIVCLNIPLALICAFSLLVNGTTDFWLIQYSILNVTYFSAAYMIVDGFKRKLPLDNVFLIKTFVIAVLVNTMSAFIGFIYAPVSHFLLSIQTLDAGDAALSAITDFQVRAVGWGVGNFFIGGMMSAVASVAVCYLYSYKHISVKTFILTLMLLLSTGLFVARTSILGVLGLLLLVRDKKKAVVLITSLFLMYFVISNIDIIGSFLVNHFGISVDWAFEVLSRKGIENSRSLNTLGEMYVFPSHLSTWFIGDGLFETTKGYYMHTDVGYLRLLFYVGMCGVLYYQYYVYSLCKWASKNMKGHRSFMLLMFGLFLLLQFKGFTDMSFFLFLLIPLTQQKSRY